MGRISRSYVGFKSGKLTIIEDLGKDENGRRICQVQCECGNVKVVPLWNVLYGRAKSCGCLRTLMQHNMGLKNRKYENKCIYCGKEYIEQYSYNKDGKIVSTKDIPTCNCIKSKEDKDGQ